MPEPLLRVTTVGAREARGRFARAEGFVRETQLEQAELAKEAAVGVYHAYAPKRSGTFAGGIEGHIVPTATGFTLAVTVKDEQLRDWLHRGTGIYGPHQTPIVPRRAQFLRFEVDGRTIFARSVRGMRPNPWEDEAAEEVLPVVEGMSLKVGARITELLTRTGA